MDDSEANLKLLQQEWQIFRAPWKAQHTTKMINLSQQVREISNCYFPKLRQLMANLLVLPWSTAGVERNFSTLNRIMRPERSRVGEENLEHLMFCSIEGPKIPGPRDPKDHDL